MKASTLLYERAFAPARMIGAIKMVQVANMRRWGADVRMNSPGSSHWPVLSSIWTALPAAELAIVMPVENRVGGDARAVVDRGDPQTVL
ncbi:MAG: hypothetical protein ACRD4P_06565 [Bryobacteraceae bacterium]